MKPYSAMAVLLLLSACQAPPPEPEFTDAERQAIVTEIERLSLEMNELGRPEDQEAWMAFWSASADSYYVDEPGVFVQGVRILHDMEAFREFFDPSGWNRQSTNFTQESSGVAVLSPELAVQVTGGSYSVTNLEGETGPSYPLTGTTVWVREAGAWKIIHHHQSWSTTPIEEGSEG
jgi:ketosteroid isomerase-like protein